MNVLLSPIKEVNVSINKGMSNIYLKVKTPNISIF